MNKRIFPAPLLLAAMLLIFSLDGCVKKRIEDIKIHSVEIESITPHGLKSVDATLLVEVENPIFQFTVRDVRAKVYKQGVPFCDIVAEPFTIGGHVTAKYEVSGTATICEGISLATLMSAMAFKPEEYTVDISARPELRNGLGKVVTMTGLSVEELMK